MLWVDLLIAAAVASFLAAALAGVFAWRHPRKPELWPTALFLFLVLFLAAWAGGVWVRPSGPRLLGVAFIPFFLAGGVVALLLLAAATPTRRPRNAEEEQERAEEAAAVGVAFGIFFWALLLSLVAVIAIRYVTAWWPPGV